MYDIWKSRSKFEKMCKAREKAIEDPRIKDIQSKITELAKQKEELIDSIAEDIYKETYGS